MTRHAIVMMTLLLLTGCASTNVSRDYDTSVDFAAYRTWAWREAAPQETDDPRVENPLLGSRIKEAVDGNLRAKGFDPGTSGAPDFLVSYRISYSQKIGSSGNVGFSVGFGRSTGSRTTGVSVGSPSTYEEYDEETITLDIHDGETGSLAWRAASTRKVRTGQSPDEITADVNQRVAEMLEGFPP